MTFCHGECHRAFPEYHCVESMIIEWRQNKSLDASARCARCVVRSREDVADAPFDCQPCNMQEAIKDLGPVVAKQFMQNLAHKHKYRWHCFDCQFPMCRKCRALPIHVVPHNALVVDGEGAPNGPGYDCAECRYIACACGKRRDNPTGKYRLKPYTCGECSRRTCKKCGTVFASRSGVPDFL